MRSPRPAPPALPRTLLCWAFRPTDRPFALADLDEEFEERLGQDGLRAAQRWYRGQALRSIVPALLNRVASRTPSHSPSQSPGLSMRNVWNDLRHGLRSLRRSWVAMVMTVLSLGLGIGVVTTAFSLVNALLFRPPVGLVEPDRLATLYTSGNDGEQYDASSYADYRDMLASVDALGDAAAIAVRSMAVDHDGTTSPILVEEVTGNYFRVTGIQPALGRTFAPTETGVGRADRVVVLGHDLWHRRFGADPDLIGQTVRLDGHAFTVIGVAPKGVTSRRVPLNPDAWIPLGVPNGSTGSDRDRFEDRSDRAFLMFGRLTDGATIEQLQAQASVLASRLRLEYPDSWTDDREQGRSVTVVPERSSRLNPNARRLLGAIGLFFVGATMLVLLIACSNVTSLFLGRAAARQREMALRAALGASRGRLMAMLATEGIIPGALSGGVGVCITWLALRWVGAWNPPINVPIRLTPELDHRVLAFAVILSIIATVAFSLFPAARASRPDLVPSLKNAERTARHRVGVRDLLVVFQCASAVVLVVGATLFVRALQNAATVDLGVNADRIAVVSTSLDPDVYGPTAGYQHYADLQQRLAALGEIEDVQLARRLELTFFGLQADQHIDVPGAQPLAAETQRFGSNAVSPGYLRMLGVPILRGRAIEVQDRAGTPHVAVINETFAERFWPAGEALGRVFRVWDGPPPVNSAHRVEPRTFQVIGIARDGKYFDYDDGATPYFWTSLYQEYAPTVAVLAKGGSRAESLIPILEREIPLAAGELRQLPASTLSSQIAIQFAHLRVASTVLGWSGGFGLFLAMIGIYGVMALAVTRRTKEMAVRLAIGASPGQVVGTVVQSGIKLAAVGLAAGMLLAIPMASLLRGVLVGVSPIDPIALGGGTVVLLLTATLASLVPAIRVTRINPVTTLRGE